MDIDLKSEFEKGLTGAGTKMLQVEQLYLLADLCKENNVLIQNVETYALRGELEVPCIEFGLYLGDTEKMTSGMSWIEKCNYAQQDLRLVVDDALESGDTFGFRVWLEREN